MAAVASFAAIEKKLRTVGLGYPEAVEDFPWGERVFKVRKKIFAFVGRADGELHVTTKLPYSGPMALSFDFVEPTGYGLGRAGWVTATFKRGVNVPIDMLTEWIEESYRAIAPKTLVKGLAPRSEAPFSASSAPDRPARRRALPSRGSSSGRGGARGPASRRSKRSGGGSAKS